MTGHRAIKREGDSPAIYAQETGRTILRCLKANVETQPIDVELLCNAEIVCWQNRYGARRPAQSPYQKN